METIGNFIVTLADFLGGYPLFFLLIGGGLYLFIRSGAVSLRRLPAAVKALRVKSGDEKTGQISSVQALASAIAATVGLGNIAGVAIALTVGGPGAIFWMWISALIGMCTKYHEGTLSVMYKGTDSEGRTRGGMMYIIERAFGPRWRFAAMFFAFAGMFGTLCILNANQLTQAVVSATTTPDYLAQSEFLNMLGSLVGSGPETALRLIIGLTIAIVVAVVVLNGVKRIARVASVLVPFMVAVYFVMVLYIIITHFERVPTVIAMIFEEAFNLRAGIGALAGIALIGSRRAALVNEAGIGTASIMHGQSKNTEPVREGLVAMLAPAFDSGFVCTCTAMALLLCVDFTNPGEIRGLDMCMEAFGKNVPFGSTLLLIVVASFALSSMFSYSYYGTSCASYLFGEKRARLYTWLYILSLVVFAVIPVGVAVGFTDLFYALMAIPSMATLLILGGRVRAATKEYFSRTKNSTGQNSPDQNTTNPNSHTKQ